MVDGAPQTLFIEEDAPNCEKHYKLRMDQITYSIGRSHTLPSHLSEKNPLNFARKTLGIIFGHRSFKNPSNH